jgi:hypothetical protein
MSSNDEKKRLDLLKKARQAIQDIPNPEERIEVYKQLEQQGVLTPELEQAITVGDTALEQIKTDPRLREAQMSALGQLQELGKSGGLDQADRLNIEEARQRAASEASRQQAAVQESMARRGISGSGLEMAQRQMAGQAAANQSSMMDQRIQAEARRRALEAMMQGGQLAGSIRGQDFGEESRKKEAQDLINRFNATAMQGVGQRNAQAKNAAQEANLRAKQHADEVNVGIANREMDHRRLAPIGGFQRELAKQSAAAGNTGPLADFYKDQAQGTRDMWSGLIAQGGKAGAAFMNKPASPAAQPQVAASSNYDDNGFRMEGVEGGYQSPFDKQPWEQ